MFARPLIELIGLKMKEMKVNFNFASYSIFIMGFTLFLF
ncbi:hypothetical protein BCAH1134_C0689 (plasmid) [Bacillus cereus AH1134]|nr:hypothetical protein BCAH1134_C0689 [Bacillus cereus AH1134]